MSGTIAYAARRYLTMTRGAHHVLARLRDDLKKADPELEGDASIWAEEIAFLHQALYDAADDLEVALQRYDGEGTPA